MKNLYLAAGALLVSMVAVSEANAQYSQCRHCGSGGYGGGFHASYHANVQWPKRYIPPARRAVCQTYAAMISNGWRRQNLLGGYHFDPHTNQLTEAGKLKIDWILTQAPVHRRGIFVERGENQAQTAQRIAAVHDNAASKSPTVGPVAVNDTHIVAEGHPAEVVDHVFVGFQQNQPLPVLPASTASSESGE
ncbi:MAG: hypothetical protein MI725_14550 [Pirellulales bacterium]|nr:hypothetical protein [Pirellulales bacterium]